MENNIPVDKVHCKGTTDGRLFDDKNIIVSLTSFPDRIRFVSKTIETILQQDLKPNLVILWLSESQFPDREKNLPKKLLKLKQYGLTIKWCEDIKSYKKIIPALQQFPNDIIITADDDLLYPKDWIRKLIESYYTKQDAIHCHLITEVKCSHDLHIQFKNVYGHSGNGHASNNYKILSGAGTLFPPGTLHSDVIKKELFMKLAPTNDDIWLWAMALKKGTEIYWIENGMSQLYYPKGVVEFSSSLYKINNSGENLRLWQMMATFRYYDLFRSLLIEEDTEK